MRPAVMLLTSNGAGLGHLARMTAVGHELDAAGTEPVLASMSSALPLVTRATGFRGEYLPAPRRGWVAPRRWTGYFRDRVVELATEVDARAVVYDGVVPYAGLLLARAQLPHVPFVWSRRGFWKPGANRSALRSAAAFDLVIEPGDLCGSADEGATRAAPALRLPPISLATGAAASRAESRRRLGLRPTGLAALVTLGTSIRGDLGSPGGAAVRTFLDDPQWQVAVTSVPLEGSTGWGVASSRVVTVEGEFPLAPLLGGFDAAVAGAGYNSVHELLPSCVPTLLVPKHRGVDDQDGRARCAAERGWALAAGEEDLAGVAARTRDLLDADVRAALAAACAALPAVDGAGVAARAILELAGRPGRHATRLAERTARAELVARRQLASWLSRRAPGGVPGRVPVWAGAELARADLLGERPVEHVLPGSSPEYAARRRVLAENAYHR